MKRYHDFNKREYSDSVRGILYEIAKALAEEMQEEGVDTVDFMYVEEVVDSFKPEIVDEVVRILKEEFNIKAGYEDGTYWPSHPSHRGHSL